jgi:hypothetical protein
MLTSGVSLNQAVIQGEYYNDSISQSGVTVDCLALPPGTEIISAEEFGYSAWAMTARISAILADQVPKTYFLKV